MTAALVVSSDSRERSTYSDWLRGEGYRVVEADSAAHAIARCAGMPVSLAVADLASPSVDGPELIHGLRAVNSDAKLVMLSGRDAIQAIVEVLKAGASDLLVKPIERSVLLATIRRLDTMHELREENARLRDELQKRFDFSQIVARSPGVLRALALADKVARRDTSVLITGESGTGKELLARAIHVNSARRHRRLVAINCAAIPEPLLESELFGYRRGAFTGATTDKAGLLVLADGGTILLDEIAELPLALQAKLLRFLQEGTCIPLGSVDVVQANVRVIAATNADLEALVERGAFRRDLYYRLSAFPIHVPPLRERREDIVPLAYQFLRALEQQVGKRVPGLSREAIAYLTSRPWRGNVRELQNAVERAVIVSEGNLLTSADFRSLERAAGPPGIEQNQAVWRLPENGIDLRELNRALITEAVARHRGNVSAAARLLGLSRPALRYRLNKYRVQA